MISELSNPNSRIGNVISERLKEYIQRMAKLESQLNEEKVITKKQTHDLLTLHENVLIIMKNKILIDVPNSSGQERSAGADYLPESMPVTFAII